MKRLISIIISLSLMLTTVLLVDPEAVSAEEDLFYTYTYDYWGIERESPDAYAMNSVITTNKFGIGNLNSAEGMFVRDDMLYICDTLNHRIIQLQYNNDEYTYIKSVRWINNNGKVESLSQPYDIYVTEDNIWYIADFGNERIVAIDDSQNDNNMQTISDTEQKSVSQIVNEHVGVVKSISASGSAPSDSASESSDESGTDSSDEDASVTDTSEGNSTEDTQEVDTSEGAQAEDASVADVSEDVSTEDARTEETSEADAQEAESESVKAADVLKLLNADDLSTVKAEIRKPEDEETIDADFKFKPMKLVVDAAGRIFVQAQNVNKGFMEFESNGEFIGYMGAADVQFNMIDYFYKMISTQEQRDQMDAFVPTEYNNVALDSEGFIYATIGTYDDSSSGSTDPVRKLNTKGNDILIRNGYFDPRGDIQYGAGGGYTGPSKFTDVAVLDNDCYYCLDSNRGRIFGYDFQGNMLYAFGGIGYREGNFKLPVAIEELGDSLLILDKELGTITQMTLTEYGKLINDALNTYKKGEYDVSADYWEKVLKLNGNYDLAYIGIGRALLRQDKFEEAMKYFKLKLDYKNYSKAYKLYRKEWVEDNIGYVFAVFIAWLLFIFIKNTIKRVRREVNEE